MVKTYPAVLLMARHGRRIAVALACVVALAALGCYVYLGSVPMLIGGLVLAAAAWAVMRVAAEIVEVVAETLLPR
ncbi:MAG: hypothetical protein Q7T63_00430 [Burkholderiaceae bacterium]|nr:hypothetical protein [Burkholderiaceae bacterium]